MYLIFRGISQEIQENIHMHAQFQEISETFGAFRTPFKLPIVLKEPS